MLPTRHSIDPNQSMVKPADMRPANQADASGAPVVALHRVSKLFPNDVLALDQLDLAVQSGEFLSLIGPSGCGKSSALRLIAGLSAPSSGTLTWPHEGGISAGPSGRLGFVFQEPTLMPWATVFANVFLPLRLAGVTKTEATPQVMDALSR